MTAPTACPDCGAALRPDAPWCTLCYADLRPKTEPKPEPEPEPLPEPTPSLELQPRIAQADPLTAPLDAVTNPLTAPVATGPDAPAPTWPCTGCGTANPIERDACVSCGSGFLAGARNEAPLLHLPVVGDLTKLSRVQRFALAGGVVLAFLLLTVLVGLALD